MPRLTGDAEDTGLTKALLTCGTIAGPVFVATFLIEGATRGGGYDPLRHSVSSLSIGPLGWIQITNFIVIGTLMIAFAIGLRRAHSFAKGSLWGPLLIGLAGLGFIGAGIFVSDPVFGYPPGLPIRTAQYTREGHLHDFFSMFVFLGFPAASFVVARGFAAMKEYGWMTYSILTGLGMPIAFVLAGVGFSQHQPFLELAGVYQRLSIVIALTWTTLLAIFARCGRKCDGS
jgi:hypothetical membrane protein